MALCPYLPNDSQLLRATIEWLLSENKTYNVSYFKSILQHPRQYIEWHATEILTINTIGYPVPHDPCGTVREIILSPKPKPSIDHADIGRLIMPNNRVPGDIFIDFLNISNEVLKDHFFYYDPYLPGGSLTIKDPDSGILATPKAVQAVASAINLISERLERPIRGHKAFLLNFNNPWLHDPFPKRLYISYLG